MKKLLSVCLLFTLLTVCLFVAFSQDVKSNQSPANSNAALTDEAICPKEAVDTKVVIHKKLATESTAQALKECSEGEGTVVLKAILHASGKVTDVEVVRASPCEGFDKKAIRAARKVKFTPATRGGTAVSQCATYRLSYQKIRAN